MELLVVDRMWSLIVAYSAFGHAISSVESRNDFGIMEGHAKEGSRGGGGGFAV